MRSDPRGQGPAGRIKDFAVTAKPWGRELLLAKTDRYAFKEILMNKGTRCSLQSHQRKCETIYVDSGTIELEIVAPTGGSVFDIFKPGEAYTIPPGTIHRVKVLEDCRLFEVSTPELDDITRHQDDYQRGNG